MFYAKKKIRMMFATGLLLTLAACGGEPSDGDIKDAVAKEAKAESEARKHLPGGVDVLIKGLVPEIKSVKKIGCKADGEKAYKCDVEMEVTQMGNTNKGVVPIRFVKGSDGWVGTK